MARFGHYLLGKGDTKGNQAEDWMEMKKQIGVIGIKMVEEL